MLTFVGEFSSPLLRCPTLTLHIIQMRAPAASVPRWLGALGSVTELSPLELSLTAPLTTHHPAISAWVGLCGSFHNLHPLLYVLCAQGCPRGKAHCQSVPGYAVSLRHKMRHLPEVLWFLVIGIMPPPLKVQQHGSLSPQHLPYLCPLPKLPPPRSLCSTMLTCLPWGWKFFLMDPN